MTQAESFFRMQGMVKTEDYILDVTECQYNKQNVKMFEYFKRSGDQYVFAGHFVAPADTTAEHLIDFVGD